MNKEGTIPNDNPFLASTTGNNRLIWTTGRIFINDGIPGANYGWPSTEGATTTKASERLSSPTITPTSSAVAPFLSGANSVVNIRTNSDSSLYYLERSNGGRLMRIA